MSTTEDPTATHAYEMGASPSITVRQQTVEAYRAAMRDRITRPAAWIAIALAYLVGNLACGILLARDGVALISAILLLNVVAWTAWYRLWRHDVRYRAMAILTPIIDRSNLTQQIRLLGASARDLRYTLETGAEAGDSREATMMLRSAVQTLIRRGDSDHIDATSRIETSRGPEIWNDGQALDAIDEVVLKLKAMDGERLVLGESIAALAIDVLGPLQSIQAAHSKEAVTTGKPG